MNIEEIRQYYLNFPYVSESFPFDDTTLVFKVGTKMFGYIPLSREHPYIVLKCDPDRAIDLREHYEAVEPAWHMNKKHWNGIYLDRDMSKSQILELVKHSYQLVWQGLTKKDRDTLENQSDL